MCAAKLGSVPFCEVLLERGIYVDVQNERLETALTIALTYTKLDVATILIKKVNDH